MSSLLLKQFYSNRSSLLMVGAMLLLFPLLLFNNEDGPFTPLVFAVMMTWYFAIGMDMNEHKNDTDVLVNSLPVTRRQIVTSKYVTLLLVGFVFIIVGKVTWFLTENHSLVQLSDAVLAMMAVALFTSVYFPLYYKLGTPFINLAFVVLAVLSFTAFPIVYYTGLRNGFWGLADLWEQHASLLLVVFCFITVALMLVSRSISIRLYEKKEF